MTVSGNLPTDYPTSKTYRLGQERIRERSPQFHSPELQALIDTYQPKKRLRKKDKTFIKRIVSFWQGYDGTIARCELCFDKQPVAIELLELHHVDENIANNQLSNILICHHPCNSKDHNDKRWGNNRNKSDPSYLTSESEIISGGRLSRETYAAELLDPLSRELAKHNIQRPLWNAWINDKERGPFSTEGRKEWKVKDLAATAVHALGLGSTITYERYIMEDVRGGILKLSYSPSGIRLVTYLGHPIIRYVPKEMKISSSSKDFIDNDVEEKSRSHETGNI